MSYRSDSALLCERRIYETDVSGALVEKLC